MGGSNSQLRKGRPILLFPIRTPHSGTGTTTLLSRDARHTEHAWHHRWSQIGVVCSINTQNGSIGADFIPHGTIWKPVAHVPMDMPGPLSVVLCRCVWTRQLGQCAMEGWPWQHNFHNTRCCYRKPPTVTIGHRGVLQLITGDKTNHYIELGSRFKDTWLILYSSFGAIPSQILTIWTLLFHACHCMDWIWFSATHPNPPILKTDSFCCFNSFIITS